MKKLFIIPENYIGGDLFKSLDELRDFAVQHEEELEELYIFDIHFDTDEWSMNIGGKRLHSLESMIDTMEIESYAYFDDVKAQHGTAAIGFESDSGEWINLYSVSY